VTEADVYSSERNIGDRWAMCLEKVQGYLTDAKSPVPTTERTLQARANQLLEHHAKALGDIHGESDEETGGAIARRGSKQAAGKGVTQEFEQMTTLLGQRSAREAAKKM
jgi:hypothetical protein